MQKQDIEIEVRFINVDIVELKKKMASLNAEDLGEDLLEDIIVFPDQKWFEYKREFIRLRKNRNGSFLTYKHQPNDTEADSTEEIEVEVSDINQTLKILHKLNRDYFIRRQQKRRHTYILDGVHIDIDTWPGNRTYVELEGDSETELKRVAEKIGFDWKDVIMENPRIVLEKYFNISVVPLRWFTFDRIE